MIDASYLALLDWCRDPEYRLAIAQASGFTRIYGTRAILQAEVHLLRPASLLAGRASLSSNLPPFSYLHLDSELCPTFSLLAQQGVSSAKIVAMSLIGSETRALGCLYSGRQTHYPRRPGHRRG